MRDRGRGKRSSTLSAVRFFGGDDPSAQHLNARFLLQVAAEDIAVVAGDDQPVTIADR